MKKLSTKELIGEIKNSAAAKIAGTLIHRNGEAIELDISFAKMFGYQKKELLGENVIKILVPHKYHGVITESIRRDYSLPYNIEGIKKDGSTFPIRIEGRTVISDNMNIIRISVFRQLTQQKI